MEPAATTLTNGSRFEDRYEILGELGSGSFGRVYQARQLSTGQSVAIKLLSPREGADESTGREAERFRRETRICAELSHTNIVGLIDSGETKDGQLYAVFAHVPGETLEQALSRDAAVSVRESVRLMTQVLEALDYAHAKGIVHRDLKPSNFMLSGTAPRRNAVVLDFGLGGLAEGRRRKEWQTLTQTREFLGTPLYAAPEQLAGDPATPRSDLYAWGLIFLECLTGRHPFAEEGAAARLFGGYGGAVEIPEWLRGHRLGELLERVTAHPVEKRDVTVEALIETLDEIARSELPEAPETAPTAAPLSERGERRHLTVMFCDLVGSSALGQRLDTEAYRRVVQAYHSRATEAIERYEGHVGQYQGDGLLVYFGYPQAHEDDAERAVRAGREMLRELATLNPRLEAEHGVRLQARVGIHTGPVVVGEMGGASRPETMALGDTLNVAARLEAFAEPDTLVISDATLRLVPGLFIIENRGTPELKGISEPIRVYRVHQPSGVSSRLDRAPALTPFVGREQELGLLLDRFEQAGDKEGQAVWIAGEAGIGKSRLVHRLRERLRETPHTWLECRSSPYTRNSALYPVIELAEHLLRFGEEDSADEKLERLERGLAYVGLEPAETVPLFASLLSLRLPERYAPLEISPQLQRQRTLEALLSWVLALGEKQPVVLLVEDLHWADPSTLEWLGLLIEQCPTAGVLVLLTFRPDFEPPWPSREHVLPVALRRLRGREAKSLIAGAIGEATLPEGLVEQIATRSDGVPLFVEELAKGVIESGRDLARSLAGLEIPETLQDSLMARLDRLGDAKQVAQLGATLGREFPYALLEAVAPLKEVALREGLGRLVEVELVYERGLPPKAIYTFKHALVQDTAYQSLLESQRKELHGRIADALEQRFPERVAGEPEVMARHCDAAGRTAQAIGHYQRAGERASQASANEEAIGHLRRAIELLGALPETRERDQRELGLQMAIAGPLSAARGWAHPECEGTFDRARALASQIGEVPERARVLVGLVSSFYLKGDLATSSELATQALDAAERIGGALDLLSAHYAACVPLYWQGEFSRSLHHVEQAIGLYDFKEHAPLAHTVGRDLGVHSRGYAAWCHVQLGHPDRGLAMSQEAVALARRVEHPLSLAFALTFAGLTHCLRWEPGLAQERADEAIALAEDLGFPLYLGMARGTRGWARAMAQGGEGVAEIQQGAAELARIGTGVGAAGFLMLLAEAFWKVGCHDDALGALGLGVARAQEQGDHLYDADLHRLRAEILLDHDGGTPEEAGNLLRRALQIARAQEAKWFELRAATSLARLLRDQGRRDEARALLQPVYAWFTEGFDTADLKDAKALLEELA